MALSKRHQAFVEHYLACYFNATEAYTRAYPHASRETARRKGHVLVTRGDIAAEIEKRIAEIAMGADEVLARLAEQARAAYSDYLAQGEVNLPALFADGKAHLIKGIKETPQGRQIEFYDAQAALALLGKHHKLFTDKVEHDLSPAAADTAAALIAAMRRGITDEPDADSGA